MICIPLKTWSKWSPEERTAATQYWQSTGTKWYIDFGGRPRTLEACQYEKDKEEYLDEMSLGGQIYRDPFNGQ